MRNHRLVFLCSAVCLLLISLTNGADAAPASATIIVGGKIVPCVVTPFVGSDGLVYAPVESVRHLGAQFEAAGSGTAMAVTGANGKSITVPCVMREGHCCVPMQKVALALGADADWQPTTQTLTLRAKLQMVRPNEKSLVIYTSYPVAYTVQNLDKPDRVYVDLYGLVLASTPASIPMVATDDDAQPGTIARIRSGQINFNTVRITLDLNRKLVFRVASAPETSRVQIALAENIAALPTEVASLPSETSHPSPLPAAPVISHENLPVLSVKPSEDVHPTRTVVNPPNPVLPTIAPANGVRITNVSLQPANDDALHVVIATTGPAKYRTETLNNPNRLAFDLAGATLDAGVNLNLPGVGPVVKAVRSGILHAPQTQFGRVVVDLARLVGYSVTSAPGENGAMLYTLNLLTPHSSTSPPATIPSSANSLSGKIVVVDPGHGAEDTGALGPDGSREKDLTLQIGRKLRDTLAQNGATVYMTRDDDSKPAVNARPTFAIQHNADYFISIHCDSSGSRNSHAGTTVYFHAQNALCRRMAQDIINQVAQISGIAADGVKSDTIRFQTGFGVLRGSPMPAVLVECGYMNNDSDLAKLKDDATQQNIALGIVAGLRDFIADRAAR